MMKKDEAISKMSSVTRRMTPGRTCGPSSQTTPSRGLNTRMKARNSSCKKVVRMTEEEREDLRKTTADIRMFFEGKAKKDNTTTTPNTEVSQFIVKSNACCSSEMVKCRRPVEVRMPGRNAE